LDVKALPRVHPPPTPLRIRGALIVTPLVVMVLPVVVALNVIDPVADHTVPTSSVMLPVIASV
jgi:hypothetical protein